MPPSRKTGKKSVKSVPATSGSSSITAGRPDVLASLRDPLADLVGWLESSRLPHVLIGGIAVGLIARPRATRDIDGMVWVEDESWKAMIAGARRQGFEPRERDPIEFIRQTRMLLLRHERSGVDIDLSLGALPFEREAIERREIVEVDGISLPVPAPEDLIIMKAVAHRPQDLADVAALLSARPDADRVRILATVREFAEALEQPELAADLERILDAGSRPTRASGGDARGKRKRSRSAPG
jgi:hypothetical protein